MPNTLNGMSLKVSSSVGFHFTRTSIQLDIIAADKHRHLPSKHIDVIVKTMKLLVILFLAASLLIAAGAGLADPKVKSMEVGDIYPDLQTKDSSALSPASATAPSLVLKTAGLGCCAPSSRLRETIRSVPSVVSVREVVGLSLETAVSNKLFPELKQ